MTAIPKSLIALDVGTKRVGVAIASLEAKLPQPLLTLDREEDFKGQLAKLIDDTQAGAIVVGLPRGLNGQETQQTKDTEAFIKELSETSSLPIYKQDEALTSKQAEAELQSRGESYHPGDIDALAATYILQDFLTDNPNLQEVMV